MRLFKSDWVDRILQVLKIPDDVPIENKRVTGAIANAQGQIEAQNFELPQERPQVRRRDGPPARGRSTPSAARCSRAPTSRSRSAAFIDDVVEGYVTGATEGFAEEWDLDALQTAAQAAVAAVAST